MSRPWLLVFIVFIVMLTSQLEWKQQFGEEIEPTSTVSLKDQSLPKRQEYVKEKIILSQEKNIQKLNEQVRNLREQLLWCKAET
ncbi:hyaluronan mediated motility receptor-related family protein [Gossypium australe]|uniref:Hyaluronan mediated motility receptor-related family protein n=1 Tax=Gossypium australe TaxID=47621 RepID=A0A5B6VS13_9ROSI|nr:hyaluronan mediated motility receptor-related family protein [Gossypium australe]